MSHLFILTSKSKFNYLKNKFKTIHRFLIIITLFISFPYQACGEQEVNIVAGIGLPELSNVGLRYQIDQAQIGFSLGYLSSKNESIFSASGDLFFHFGDSSTLSKRRNWYSRFGFNFLKWERGILIEQFYSFNVRIGREINFSKKIGMQIDTGIILIFEKEKIYTDTFYLRYPHSGFDIGIAPDEGAGLGIGIGIFYRI